MSKLANRVSTTVVDASLFHRLPTWGEPAVKAIAIAALLGGVWFAFVYRLGRSPLLLWDESHNAVNALEMAKGGSWLIPTFDGQPDYLYTKPPLLLWAMAICINLFGVSEFAVRIPSALAAVGSVAAIVTFAHLQLKQLWAGIIGGLVLVTSAGFVGNHVARTADHDALLAFLVTGFALSAFALIEDQSPQGLRYLWATAIFFALALLAKGPAVLLAVPGIVLFAGLRKRLVVLLHTRAAYLWLGLASAPYVAYVAFRSSEAEFLRRSFIFDGFDRIFSVVEGRAGGDFFYLELMARERFPPWIFLLPICICMGIFARTPRWRAFACFATCFLVTDLLVLSLSRTKLAWYDAPLYPIAALVIGVGLWRFIEAAAHRGPLLASVALAVSASSLAWVPFAAIGRTVLHGELEWSWSQDELVQMAWRDHLKDIRGLLPSDTPIALLADDSAPLALWYGRIELPSRPLHLVNKPQGIEEQIIVSCEPSLEFSLVSSSEILRSRGCRTVFNR